MEGYEGVSGLKGIKGDPGESGEDCSITEADIQPFMERYGLGKFYMVQSFELSHTISTEHILSHV